MMSLDGNCDNIQAEWSPWKPPTTMGLRSNAFAQVRMDIHLQSNCGLWVWVTEKSSLNSEAGDIKFRLLAAKSIVSAFQ
jgi:hypothetical protein